MEIRSFGLIFQGTIQNGIGEATNTTFFTIHFQISFMDIYHYKQSWLALWYFFRSSYFKIN